MKRIAFVVITMAGYSLTAQSAELTHAPTSSGRIGPFVLGQPVATVEALLSQVECKIERMGEIEASNCNATFTGKAGKTFPVAYFIWDGVLERLEISAPGPEGCADLRRELVAQHGEPSKQMARASKVASAFAPGTITAWGDGNDIHLGLVCSEGQPASVVISLTE